jgi:putative transposase
MCTAKRCAWFTSPGVAERVLRQFRSVGKQQGVAIVAYCFMPDHLHLVVESLTDTADLRAFVKLAKQRSGWEHRRETRELLWQSGYYDRVLRRDESLESAVRYVVGNPVRKGLAQSAAEWPLSGSDVFDIRLL